VSSFTFRPLTPEDLPTLHEWISRPHVAQWWSAPASLAEIEADYLPAMLPESTTRAYIALLDARPVGFIQSYVVLGSGGGWWPDETDPGARGIDQFLADEGDLNKGIGSAMVRAFVTMLFRDPSVTIVQTDPSPENERAIRSYARAGFERRRVVDTPDGRALLMFCERPE
jgi:RimJ/RimL family protein N-acetyltransferase